MADLDPLLDDYGIPTHPLAAQMVVPTWDQAGRCMCGCELAPMSKWRNPGMDWSSTVCPGCGRGFVDEEEYIAVYDDGLEDDG